MKILILEWVYQLTSLGGVHGVEAQSAVERQVTPLSVEFDQSSGATRPWIAPTSLVGSLSSHIRSTVGEEAVRAILGDAVKSADTTTFVPSTVRFLGSRVAMPAGSNTVRHYRAPQDRKRGAAANSGLVQLDWLPIGTTVTLWAIARSSAGSPGTEPVASTDARTGQPDLANLRRQLTDITCGSKERRGWNPTLGAGKSIGKGRTKLTAFRSEVLDLTNVSDLAWYLGGLRPETLSARLRGASATSTSAQLLDPTTDLLTAIEWAVVDGLHIGSGLSDPDAANRMLLLKNAAGDPLVPASSWKGLLRSRCEFILRSLGIHACEGGTTSCAGCPACCVFGGTGKREGSEGSGWASRISVADASVTGPTVADRDHVAIDRFTGGAADGMLFQLETVTAGTVTLKVESTSRPAPDYAKALITLALKDLEDALIGLGGSSSRGYGTLKPRGKLPSVDFEQWRSRVEGLRRLYPLRDDETASAEREMADA